MPCGKKRKRHKIATHKRKKRLRKTVIRRRAANIYLLVTGPLLMRAFSFL